MSKAKQHQNFICHDKDLPNTEGSNVKTLSNIDRQQCKKKCNEDNNCDAFAWRRDGQRCYTKKNFNSSSAKWGTRNLKNFDFCYDASGEINKLSNDISKLNSDNAKKQSEKIILENDIKDANLVILDMAQAISSDDDLMVFLNQNNNWIDKNTLNTLVSDINVLKKTIATNRTKINALKLKNKRQKSLQNKKQLEDAANAQFDSLEPTPKEVKANAKLQKIPKNTGLSKKSAEDRLAAKQAANTTERFTSLKLNYMERFNNKIKSHEKYLEERKILRQQGERFKNFFNIKI